MVKVFKPIGAIGKDTIREQQKDYYKTLAEFASENYETIIRGQPVNAGTNTLYTVPSNKVLFLTNAWVHASSPNDAANQLAVEIFITPIVSGSQALISLTRQTSNGNVASGISLNFSMPIKVPSGQSINALVSAGTASANTAGFVGFLVPFLPKN